LSKSEGISRIAKIIRGVGWLIIFVAGFIMLSDKNLGPESVGVGIVVTAILSGPCFALAWIVDGFVK
jgi:hypothetical protein